MNDQAATINHAKDSLIDLAIRFGPRLFTAALILIVGIVVSGWVSRWVTQLRAVQSSRSHGFSVSGQGKFRTLIAREHTPVDYPTHAVVEREQS